MRTETSSLRPARAVVFSPLGWMGISLLLLTGAGLQSYANESEDALLVALMFLALGLSLVAGLFALNAKKPELRVFLMTYAFCLSVGGAAQIYSLATFGKLQSTVDSFKFFRLLRQSPPFTTIPDIEKSFNSPLAVVIWQQAYRLNWALGLDFGPYLAVMFNALVMGIAGTITVRTARELFGDDSWRLNRVGTLFAFCGLFILFGSVLIRDCFTTFFMAFLLWGLVRWLCRSTFLNLSLALLFTGVTGVAMIYLRPKSVVLIGVFWALLAFCWCLKGSITKTRMYVVASVLLASLLGSTYLHRYVETSHAFQSERAEKYAGKSKGTHRGDSLGLQFVVSQPMPVRMVLGIGSLMIAPIPLWSYLQAGEDEYHLIKGYHGVYQVVVIPLALAGFWAVLRRFRADRRTAMPLMFLALYLLLNLAAVVATSLEQRHLAQFMPAFCILAALPDTRSRIDAALVRRIAPIWLGLVILVHLAWGVAKLVKS